MAALLNLERLDSSGCEQQRPVLRHRSALPHAPLRHNLHRCVQVEDEQAAGFLHVHTLLCVPGGQRNAGGQDHQLPDLRLIPLSCTPLLFFWEQTLIYWASE